MDRVLEVSRNMLIGYARTSTAHQNAGLDDQLVRLKNEGCEKIFSEQVSSVYEREELRKAIDFVRSGDIFIVTKIDRLARSLSHLMEIINVLEKKNVQLKILDFGLDTKTATGKMMLQVLGAVSQFEREMMLERQRLGIQKAKNEGKYKGRTLSSAQIKKLEKEIKDYDPTSEQSLSIKEIANFCEVSVATVYKKLKATYPDKLKKRSTKKDIVENVFNGNEAKYNEVNFFQALKRKGKLHE